MIDAAWLRALDADGLTELLRRRPDAMERPEPASLAELADRFNQPASVAAAVRQLDRPTLQVAEALAALGGQAHRSDLHRLLGVVRPDDGSTEGRDGQGGATASQGGAGAAADRGGPCVTAVDQALDALRGYALLVESGPEPRLIPMLRDAWERPLGLGVAAAEAVAGLRADDLRTYARNLGLKPAARKAALVEQVLAALRDPDLVVRIVRQAPAPTRQLLVETAHTGEPVPEPHHYFLSDSSRSRSPAQWAAERGLLIRPDEWGAELEMPAEVALALRGPDWTAPFDPLPPQPPVAARSPEVVTQDAAAAGAAALRLVSALADEAGRTPITVLKAGGVGTRELRRLAKRTGAAEAEVRLGLAVGHQAGLLAFTEAGLAPTEEYDDWLRHEPAQRLATLLTAWWALPYVPTADTDGAWTPAPRWRGARELRAAVLRAAAGLAGPEPTGREDRVAGVEPSALADLVLWSQPYAFDGPDPLQRAAACWGEAGSLGAAGANALAAAGRALLAGDDPAAALTGLGATEHQVRLQADLTALVAGTPSAELTALLDATADRESRGAASIWRFTPDSVRRAFDAGQQADALLDELAKVATGGVPQPLEYLVRDVARRHGVVRGQEVACCLRSDDPALLAQIAADRRLRGLGLRVLAPTVLAGARPLAETLAGLREAGYAPVAERSDGTAVLEQARPHRAAGARSPARRVSREAGSPGAARTAAAPAQSRSAEPVTPETLARTLLAKPDSVAPPASKSLYAVRDAARQLSDGPARILAHAIDTGSPVRIDYVNQAGNVTSRVIEDIDLSGTMILAWCRLREDERMFNLGRILAVSPVSS